jgi:Flp pilus assembly protein CpaB
VNPWPFIIAAYALTLLGTAAVLLWSWAGMRHAEAEAGKLGRDREA